MASDQPPEEPGTSSTTTECTGGATDGRSTNLTGVTSKVEDEYVLVLDAFRLAQPYDVWMSKHDFSLWEDRNGVAGVQRTARVCYVLDSEFRIVDQYQVYPADQKL
ncbi:MAG TPA: hypothetical protein VNZ52_16085 [Candidatus Thermoplasmatota archaeon]|nr:hypothetical protein [Candidatus Thermoplasmatota archaeon]